MGKRWREQDSTKFVGFSEHAAVVLWLAGYLCRHLQRATGGLRQGVTRQQALLRVAHEIAYSGGTASCWTRRVPHLHCLLVRCRRAAISPRLLRDPEVIHERVGAQIPPSVGMCGAPSFEVEPRTWGQQLLTAPDPQCTWYDPQLLIVPAPRKIANQGNPQLDYWAVGAARNSIKGA